MTCSHIESLSQRHRDVAALDAYFLQAPGHTSVYGPMVECLNNSDLSRFPCGTVSDLRFLYVEYLRFTYSGPLLVGRAFQVIVYGFKYLLPYFSRLYCPDFHSLLSTKVTDGKYKVPWPTA